MNTKPLLAVQEGEEKYCSTQYYFNYSRTPFVQSVAKIHFSVCFHVLNNFFHFFFVCFWMSHISAATHNKEKYTSSINIQQQGKGWSQRPRLESDALCKWWKVYDPSDLLNTYGRTVDHILHKELSYCTDVLQQLSLTVFLKLSVTCCRCWVCFLLFVEQQITTDFSIMEIVQELRRQRPSAVQTKVGDSTAWSSWGE